MTEIAKLELELVARARNALAPEPEDRRRLREALAAKIAVSAAVVGTASVAANVRPLRQLLKAHRATLSTVLVMTGAVAFCAGYFTGHRTRTVVVKTVTVVQAPTPTSNAAPAPVSPETLTSASLTSSFDLGHSVARPRAAASAAPSALPPSDSLSDELELLRRAERTLRSGNSQVALGLLDELDARFPKGQLLEERTAARVMARCQLDTEEGARARGNAYLLAHSQSVYADRVRTLCHLDSSKSAKDSPKTGD